MRLPVRFQVFIAILFACLSIGCRARRHSDDSYQFYPGYYIVEDLVRTPELPENKGTTAATIRSAFDGDTAYAVIYIYSGSIVEGEPDTGFIADENGVFQFSLEPGFYSFKFKSAGTEYKIERFPVIEGQVSRLKIYLPASIMFCG